MIDTESLRSVARMARCSGFDQVTGLPNLRQFLREVQRELARAHRYGGGLVVLVLEPKLEIELPPVARQLLSMVREEDVVARLGHAMLGVLLVAASADAGYQVAGRIQATFNPSQMTIGMRVVGPGLDRRHKSGEIIREAVAALAEAQSSGGCLMASWDGAGRA